MSFILMDSCVRSFTGTCLYWTPCARPPAPAPHRYITGITTPILQL